MNKYIILNKRKNKKDILNLLKEYNGVRTFKNNRTEIWENDEIQISIDKSVIRILILNSKDIPYYRKLILKGE